METKRCANCHKLQRADAQACSRCGHVFVQKKSRPSTREWTQPSIPPASPHRAGHYSGLHPEDQPYQSNKIAIHYAPLQDNENRRSSLPEPEHIVLPITDPALRRRVQIPEHYDEPSAAEFPIIEEPVFYERRRWHLPRPAIPVLLAISCIFFVLASSILAVVLIRKSAPTTLARLTTSPSTLRANDTLTLNGSKFTIHSLIVFTYDNNQTLSAENQRPLETQTDARGTFSLQLRIPHDWEPGQHTIHATDATANLSVSTTITVQQPPEAPPALRLFTSNLSFGTNAPGISSDKTISLLNNGGGQITWHATSDQPWLTASPSNGVFSGRENVLVIVNRTALTPASYTGHILFLPDGNSNLSPLTITVSMGVEALVSPSLAISPSSLPFSMVVGQQPVLKAIILTNSSNQALTWSASASTNDQGHWLSAAPATGTLDAGVEGYMNAQVDVQGLSPGSYQGTLTFSSGAGGVTQQVIISLTVS
jgi:hypothetical protein